MEDNRGTDTGHSSDPGGLAGLTVLVVDDDENQREVLALLLEYRHAQVITAASMKEALNALEAARPDVLLSDIAMPYEDGYDLIRAVRALPPERGGQTPAIALTAFPDEDERERALGAGFQALFGKPILWSTLIQAIIACTAHPFAVDIPPMGSAA